MRRTGGSSHPEWVTMDETLVGIMLGADFTAEHEMGIAGIKIALNMKSIEHCDKRKIFGMPRYRIGEVNPDYFWYRENSKGDEAVLVFGEEFTRPYFNEFSRPNLESARLSKFSQRFDIDIYRDDCELATAWDEKSFGIHVKGKDGVSNLKALHQAFIDGDIVVFLGAPPLPAFANSSLHILVASAIPEEGAETMKNTDRENWELQRDAKKTRIEKRLRDSGKRWYSLYPRRAREDEASKSKYDIMFWLNPMEQKRYGSGWYTVEELRQWANDKGPVLKEAV